MEELLSIINEFVIACLEGLQEIIKLKPATNEEIELVERLSNFGWAPYYYGEINPRSQEEADNLIVSEISVELLFNMLCDMHAENDYIFYEEILEAINCYKQNYYRACAMIITSLIERKIVLFQKSFGEKNIQVGSYAIRIIGNSLDWMKEKSGKEVQLQFIGTFKFLKKFFERTNNFKNDKIMINRNMLMHGMWTNKLTYVDCLKLFIALFDICIIDFYYSLEKDFNSA